MVCVNGRSGPCGKPSPVDGDGNPLPDPTPTWQNRRVLCFQREPRCQQVTIIAPQWTRSEKGGSGATYLDRHHGARFNFQGKYLNNRPMYELIQADKQTQNLETGVIYYDRAKWSPSVGFIYVGCFVEDAGRDFDIVAPVQRSFLPEECGVYCSDKGAPFMAIRNKNRCACKKTPPKRPGTLDPKNDCPVCMDDPKHR